MLAARSQRESSCRQGCQPLHGVGQQQRGSYSKRVLSKRRQDGSEAVLQLMERKWKR
jgi:hypothetical protein